MSKKFLVVWNTEDCCDGFEQDDFESAKRSVWEIYEGWLQDALLISASEPDFQPEDWDVMIDNCWAEIKILNPDTNQYDHYWYPSDADLTDIGWDYWNEIFPD